MDEIIQKRVDLINFFLNENKTYTKEEVLNKEFAVLTFSPNEEYIDYMKTEFDHICVNLDTYDFSEDVSELYIKGIIIDVDNKKDYSIIHLQNKDHNVSISFGKNVVFHYSNYFNIGDVVIVKCNSYKGRLYADFLIDFQHEDDFENEKKYISKESERFIKNYNQNPYETRLLGLVHTCRYFISSNGTPCIRMELYTPQSNEKTVAITCKNRYNRVIPQGLKAGDFIKYTKSKDVFVNNVKVIE